MADYFCCTADQQLDLDDLHRLLPREILADIGIGDDDTTSAFVVDVEELAARLAGVLGPSSASRRRHQQRQPPPPTMAAAHQGCRGSMNRDGELMMEAAACYYSPRPVLGTKGGVNGGATPFHVQGMQQRARRFAAPAIGTKNASHRPLLLPPARSCGGSAGTGVFLPRADAYNQARPACSSRQARTAGLQRKEAANNNATMMMTNPQGQ